MISADEFKRETGSWLLTNPWEAASVIGGRPTLQDGPAIVLKSPRSMSEVGTYAVNCPGSDRCSVPWYPAKKNSESFLMGPPITPPNWLRLRVSRAGAKKLRAFISPLR